MASNKKSNRFLTCSVHAVAFSKLFKDLLATGSDDKTIKIWNSSKGALLKTLIGHSDIIRCLTFNNDNILASGSDDKTIKLWKSLTWDLIKTLEGHTDGVEIVIQIRDGSIVSGSRDKTIKV